MNSKKSTPSLSPTAVPARLRNALRLIHCLQKERGASSSLYARKMSQPSTPANGNSDNDSGNGKSGIGATFERLKRRNTMSGRTEFLEKTVIASREATDAAFVVFLSSSDGGANHASPNSPSNPVDHYMSSRPWEISLRRVRACVDGTNTNTSTSTSTGTGTTNTYTNNSGSSVAPPTSGNVITNGNSNDTVYSNDETNGTKNNHNNNNDNKISSHIVGSHRIVVMFNILIGNIIDEAIVQVIKSEQHVLKRKNASSMTAATTMTTINKSTSMCNINQGMNIYSHIYTQNPSPPTAVGAAAANRVPGISEPPKFFARSLPLHYDGRGTGGSTAINTSIKASPISNTKHNIININGNGNDNGNNYGNGNINGINYINGRYNDESKSPPARLSGSVIIHGNAHKHEQHHMIIDTRGKSLHEAMSKLSTNAEHEYKIPIQGGILPSTSLIVIDKKGNKKVLALRNLMSLLLSFVRLKESIGLERAILSNLMATDIDKTHDSSSKLLTGLVVEDANQRMIIRELQSQTKKVVETKDEFDLGENLTSLLVVMEEMLKPGKAMERLQEMIRTNFNLKELRKAMPFNKFWQVITIYIDKLHSMELLLVEELQSSWMQLSLENSIGTLEETKKTPSHNSLASLYTNLNSDAERERQQLYNVLLCRDGEDFNESDLTDEEALNAIARMPADQIKRLLLSHLKYDDDIIKTPMTAPAIPFEDNFNNMQSLQIPYMMKEWEIDLYEIEFRKRIGRGVGGTTYLAKWSGQNVAVKIAAITDLGLEGWHTEVNSLQRLHHPNVIRLLGSIYNPSPQTYGLVLEYCESGDLSFALQRPTPSNFFWRVADDVANGMNYLHRKNILHRDIKPGNVLLNGDVPGGNFTAKLSDFGVAIMHHSPFGEEHTAETGTYRWMAPEIIRHEAYSFNADVYSYALVVWQLVTHEIPFKNFTQIEAAGKVAIDCSRPPFPHRTPELIVALIETCWRECPDERLSFEQISIELKEIHKVLNLAEKAWLSEPHGHPVYDIIPRPSPEQITEPRELVENNRKEGTGWKNSHLSKSPKNSGKGRRKNIHRSKSPNSTAGGGLFSIFNPNKNR